MPGSEADLVQRARRAFSLRRNLRLLLVPQEGRLRPLDGLRALSILWVVFFHTGWFIPWHVPPATYQSLVFSRWMLPVWRGDFGVDVFFVLSGFLIAGMLIDERERTGRLRLGLFYGRRLARLWPALVAAVVASRLLVGDHPERMWANLLYVVNFVPVLQAPMGWTWSLAIEEQFYMLCPWLVHALAGRRAAVRLGLLGGLGVGLAAVTTWIVVAHRFHAHDAEIVILRDLRAWARAYDLLYDKPWTRAGPLLAGVGAAYVYRMRGAMAALDRGGARATVGLALALLVGVVCTHWPFVVGAPRWVEVAYLGAFRTLFGLVVAYVLLLSVSRHPVGRALGRLLSTRALYPFAQLAYAAYLLNPLAIMAVDSTLAPFARRSTLPAYAIFLPLDLVATFVAATALHLFIERPFMELRPRE